MILYKKKINQTYGIKFFSLETFFLEQIELKTFFNRKVINKQKIKKNKTLNLCFQEYFRILNTIKKDYRKLNFQIQFFRKFTFK